MIFSAKMTLEWVQMTHMCWFYDSFRKINLFSGFQQYNPSSGLYSFARRGGGLKFIFVTSVDVAGHQRVKQKIRLFFENGLEGLKWLY